VLEYRDLIAAMPQLYVVAVYKLLGALFGFLVILAEKLVAVRYVTAFIYDINAIVLHRLSHFDWGSGAVAQPRLTVTD
jgi:hypothetical protein